MDKLYLFGLDISLKNTGVAIYDLTEKRFVYIDSFNTEKIYATKNYKGLHLNAIKLNKLSKWFEGILEEYPPALVSIERMFSRFPLETQAIAKATGVIQETIWDKPQSLYPPKSVKLAIVHGSATKEDVANSILTSTTYNYLKFKNEDESDAVAVALTYLIDKELVEWKKPKWSEIKKLREPKEEKKK